jgi:hypothetical protein
MIVRIFYFSGYYKVIKYNKINIIYFLNKKYNFFFFNYFMLISLNKIYIIKKINLEISF